MSDALTLTQSEVDVGRALSANIQALQNSLVALAMTEQLYIESLRQARKLSDQFTIRHWEIGFEEVTNGQQNNQ